MKRSLIILFLFTTTTCAAQWVDANMGLQLYAFGVHDSTLYVSRAPWASGTNNVFRLASLTPPYYVEADNGIDFTQGNVTSFASLGRYVFAGISHSDGSNGPVFVTTNNGSTWSHGSTAGPVISNGRYLFAMYTSPSEIARSRDTGKTWDSVASLSVENSFGSTGSYIFANTTKGTYRSTDSGSTWSSKPSPVNGPFTVMGTLIFIANGSIAESMDSGSNWTTLQTIDHVNCLASDDKNLFAGCDTGLFVSTDTGKTWTVHNDGLTLEKKISLACVFDTLLFVDAEYNSPFDGPQYLAYFRPIRELLPPDSTPLAVAQAPVTDTLSVYPNPLTGTVTIQNGAPITNVSVLNLLGMKVLDLPNVQQPVITLDLSSFPAGTYFIQIKTAKEILLRKIEKE